MYVFTTHKDVYMRVQVSGFIQPVRAQNGVGLYNAVNHLPDRGSIRQVDWDRFYSSQQAKSRVEIGLHGSILQHCR